MLVKYLRALLGQFWSKKDNNALSTLGYPSGQNIDLSWSPNQKVFVAPKDGLVYACIRSTGVNEFLNISHLGMTLNECRSAGVHQLMTISCFVKKGDALIIDCSIPNARLEIHKLLVNYGSL